MKKIPILMYHALEDAQHPSGQTGAGDRVYVLQVEQFQQQMETLKRNGFTPILARQLQDKSLPKRPIVISFDDGHVSNFHLALPILLNLDFVATFFITTGFVNQAYYLNPKQIAYLAERGMEIGSHSVSHPFFNDLNPQQTTYELAHSKHQLEVFSGQRIDSFSAPGGRLHPQTCQLAQQQGYRFTFCSQFGLYNGYQHGCNIPRIAIKRHTSLTEFRKIVLQNAMLFTKKRINDLSLLTSKKLLGNDNYVRLREFLLQRRGDLRV